MNSPTFTVCSFPSEKVIATESGLTYVAETILGTILFYLFSNISRTDCLLQNKEMVLLFLS